MRLGYDWEQRCFRDDSDRLGVGGPAFASSTFAEATLRSRLEVWYLDG